MFSTYYPPPPPPPPPPPQQQQSHQQQLPEVACYTESLHQVTGCEREGGFAEDMGSQPAIAYLHTQQPFASYHNAPAPDQHEIVYPQDGEDGGAGGVQETMLCQSQDVLYPHSPAQPNADFIELTRLMDEVSVPAAPNDPSSLVLTSLPGSSPTSSVSTNPSPPGLPPDLVEPETSTCTTGSTTIAVESSQSQQPLIQNMMVDLNCNDENFSCFTESILFGDDDNLDNVEEVAIPASVRPPEQSASNYVPPPVPEPPAISISPTRDPTTRLYHCPHCEKAFQYVSRLQRHLTAHQSKRFRCEICDKFFSRADVLVSHRVKVHGAAAAAAAASERQKKTASSSADRGTSDRLLFSCPQCPSQLKSRHHLDRHLRAHVDRVGHFRCGHCAKEFTVKHKYQRHLRLHLGEKRFVCGVCGMAFLQKEFLSRHLLTHSGETPFECQSCGKAFNQLVNLRQHQERVHGTEARRLKHECAICDKRFFSQAELKNHSVYHLSLRSHVCPVCGDGFYEKRHLERHVRRKHQGGIKSFFCFDCGRTFCEKYELNYHRKTSRRCAGSSVWAASKSKEDEEES